MTFSGVAAAAPGVLRSQFVGRDDEHRTGRGIGCVDHPPLDGVLKIPPRVRLAQSHTRSLAPRAIFQRPSQDVLNFVLVHIVAVNVRPPGGRIDIVADLHELLYAERLDWKVGIDRGKRGSWKT
jgi:hypothetical protein